MLAAQRADAARCPSSIARATAIPNCSVFVDAASAAKADGIGRSSPFRTIAAALAAAAPGAVICVAEGIYAEGFAPGDKPFTLAGGFKSGSGFDVRDSSVHVSRAQGQGGSFIRIADPAPKGDALVAIDGFEITGYSQAIVRDYWESQRFEITNNLIHGNTCSDPLPRRRWLRARQRVGRDPGQCDPEQFLRSWRRRLPERPLNQNRVVIEGNRIEGNAGTEPESSHGGGLYLFGNTLEISGNLFLGNSVTGWGGGLFIGAYTPGNQPTTATLTCERLSRQSRRRCGRRLLLRRRRDLHRLARNLRPELRRQHPPRWRFGGIGADRHALRSHHQCRRARSRLRRAGGRRDHRQLRGAGAGLTCLLQLDLLGQRCERRLRHGLHRALRWR